MLIDFSFRTINPADYFPVSAGRLQLSNVRKSDTEALYLVNNIHEEPTNPSSLYTKPRRFSSDGKRQKKRRMGNEPFPRSWQLCPALIPRNKRASGVFSSTCVSRATPRNLPSSASQLCIVRCSSTKPVDANNLRLHTEIIFQQLKTFHHMH